MAFDLYGLYNASRIKVRTISLINTTYTLNPAEHIILADLSGSVAAVANGIEVQVECSITGSGDPTAWTASFNVDLSYDGGTTYTAVYSIDLDGSVNATDTIESLGGSTDLWGKASWSETELNNTNFRVRFTLTARNAVSTSARIDLVQVKVYDKSGIVTNRPAEALSDSNTGLKSPATTGTPSNAWTNGANVKVSDNNRATSSTVGNKLDTSDYSLIGSGVTITLPAVSGVKGQNYFFKKIDSTANVLTIQAASGNIEGAASQTLGTQYHFMELFSDGTSWHILRKTGVI